MITKTFSILNGFRISIADWLNTVLIDNGVFFFNIWHIVHFLGGFVLGILLSRVWVKGLRGKVFVGFCLIIAWELFEASFYLNGSSWFLAETMVDIFWDTFLGMAGILTHHLLFNKKV